MSFKLQTDLVYVVDILLHVCFKKWVLTTLKIYSVFIVGVLLSYSTYFDKYNKQFGETIDNHVIETLLFQGWIYLLDIIEGSVPNFLSVADGKIARRTNQKHIKA